MLQAPFVPPGRPRRPAGSEGLDLGSQLEELRIHVLRCERWARLDDRLDLAMSRERISRRRRGRA